MNDSTPYKLLDTIKNQFDSNLLFVEIGSDRGGGSTSYLNALARDTKNQFVAIDIDPVYLGSNIKSVTMSGEEWVEHELPSTSTKRPNIGLVYLDNFDWIDDPTAVRRGRAPTETYNLIEDYSRKNLHLTNVNSSISHLRQIKGMLPFMNDKCVVMFSDTWFNYTLDTFEGKGAGAVYLLLTEGFNVVSASPYSKYIMLARNMRPNAELSNIDLSSLSKVYEGPKKNDNTLVYSKY